jgi:hypothetical protein
MDLPDIVEADIGQLCRDLTCRGGVVKVLSMGPMHSYQVHVVGTLNLTITADRGQLMMGGDREQLAPHGLWRAFDDPDAFRQAVLRYVDRATGTQVGSRALVLPDKFSRQAFENSSSPKELASELSEVVRMQLEGAANRPEMAYFIIQALRGLGHDLHSWDESSDFVTWGDDYMNPPSPLRFLIEMRFPDREDNDADVPVTVDVTFGPWPKKATD